MRPAYGITDTPTVLPKHVSFDKAQQSVDISTNVTANAPN
jgi:hypothetical protein